jgi:hypothetical protein
MKMSKAALAAIFAGGTSLVTFSVPAHSQVLDSLRQRQSQRQNQQQQQPRGQCTLTAGEGERQYRLNQAECTAVAPLLTAVGASDWAAARAALPAAQAAATTADAKYVTAQAMLRIGIGANDTALQSQAIDALIASGGAQPNEMQALYENQLRFALEAHDAAKAQAAQARLDALNPNDPNRFTRQAQMLLQANNYAGALPLLLQAAQAMQAVGQQPSPDLRRQIAATAYQAHSPDTLRYMREWLTAAPSASGWHDTLAIFAEQNQAADLRLDAYRLMRGARAMVNERDYVQYADAANAGRAYAETAAVLQEGLSGNKITANTAFARDLLAQAGQRATAFRPIIAQERQVALSGRDAAHAMYVGDAYYGAGEYAQAAELYRAAQQKGADANTTNLRIGAALAMAGQRAQAETALRAVTGPRAELAQLWLLWLANRT